jgi:hypothetical protein
VLCDMNPIQVYHFADNKMSKSDVFAIFTYVWDTLFVIPKPRQSVGAKQCCNVKTNSQVNV